MRPSLPDSPVSSGIRTGRCVVCRRLMFLRIDKRGKGLPAKQCTCGALYCPECYEKLPGIFGEELGPIVMIFTPIAIVGAYIAYFGLHGTLVLAIFGISIIASIGFYLAIVAPASRMFGIAKRCAVCGGRTASDWSSIPLAEEQPAEESSNEEQVTEQ